MEVKLYDSELKTMEIIWANEPVSAKEISRIASEKIGWSINTTYTVVTKLVAKGILTRTEPGFICTSNVSKEEVCRAEAKDVLNKFFGGSKKALFSALIGDEKLTDEEIAELREMIGKR